MNSERILTAFLQIGDDPDRIQQLRKIVIALAISGKLDETSALQSERIVAGFLVKKGAPSQRAVVAEDQLPESFVDPSRFAPLGTLAQIEKGKTGIQQALPGPFPLVVTGAERASCDHFDFEGAAAIVPLVSSTGHGNASLNRLHYQEGRFALGTILAALLPHDPSVISARFLFEYLSAFKDELLVSRMTGTANVTLNVGRIAEIPIPLIRPGVQQKVDELMALCDRLELARTKREATRDQLTAASLARLNAAKSETFPADGRFALDALPALTTRPDQIRQIRQTILNLAVRGKLVAQDPNDEPASKLLELAKKSKRRLLLERKINRDTEPEHSTSAAEPFSPAHWLWVYLDDIGLVLGGKRLPEGATFSNERTNHIYIRVTDMKDGTISTANLKYISTQVQRQIAKYTINADDLYITIAGTIGEVGMVPELLDGQNLTENAAKIIFREIDRDFLFFVLNADDVQNQFREKTKQMAQPKLALKRIAGARIPLPPLAEQRRIVAKINGLLAICVQLESSLTTAEDTRRRLLDALLAEALKPDKERELEAAE